MNELRVQLEEPADAQAALAKGVSVSRRWVVGGMVLFLALVLPIFASDYVRHILVLICLYAYAGAGWNLLSGYTGLVSFGHSIFFGIGAYTSTVLLVYYGITPWAGMFIGGVLAAAVGLFIGYATFRYGMRGAYFALAMFAFAEIFKLAAMNFPYIRGSMGMYIPLKGYAPEIFQFSDRLQYYYVILAFLLIIMFVTYKVERSKLGYYFIAIRENDDSAPFLGIDITRYKIIAMMISAFFTAFAGTFYAQYFLFIDPIMVFGNPMTIEILLRPLIGGPGTVLGPLVGALVLTPLSEVTRTVFHGLVGIPLMLYGVTLIVTILFIPNGILGLLQSGHGRVSRWLDDRRPRGKR